MAKIAWSCWRACWTTGLLQIVKRPGPGLLAFLLGVAIGVMVTLSAAEMYIRNAWENGFWGISAAAGCGVALYYFLQPFLPDFVDHGHDKKSAEVGNVPGWHACAQLDQAMLGSVTHLAQAFL